MITTIHKAARLYQIAPIRLHSLIRQGYITKGVKQSLLAEPVVIVETSEIDSYFREHPEVIADWQKAYQEARNHYCR